MSKHKIMLPILAAIVGVAASAFTVVNTQKDSDLVWFEVNPDGTAVNSSDGIQGQTSPFGCTSGSVLCASSLSISESQVTDNGNDTYSIAPGVNIVTQKQSSEMKP